MHCWEAGQGGELGLVTGFPGLSLEPPGPGWAHVRVLDMCVCVHRHVYVHGCMGAYVCTGVDVLLCACGRGWSGGLCPHCFTETSLGAPAALGLGRTASPPHPRQSASRPHTEHVTCKVWVLPYSTGTVRYHPTVQGSPGGFWEALGDSGKQ